MAIDPLYYNSVLLLNCEGTDASTSFPDISITPKTVTANGNAQVDTAQFVTGSASALFDGTGDFLSVPLHTDFDFGTGDFTIRVKARFANVTADMALVGYNDPATAAISTICFGIHFLGATTDKIYAFIAIGGTMYECNGLSALSANTWYDIEFSRTSGVIYLFIDGALQESKAASGSINAPASRALRMGVYSNSNLRYMNGWLDAIAIDKGVGRHTTTFTPSTALFEASPPEEANADITAPMQSLSMFGGANAALTGPMQVAEFLAGASAAITGPMQTMAAIASTGPQSEFAGSAPMGVLVALGGANAALDGPMQTLSASATATLMGFTALSNPMQSVSATGLSGAVAILSMQAPMQSVAANGGANGGARVPMGLLSGSGLAGAVSAAALEAPTFILLASGTIQVSGSANLTAPMLRPVTSAHASITAPMGVLWASGYENIITTFVGWAINLQPGDGMPHQVTQYTNWPFNQIVRFGDDYIGVADDGLYLLGGDTDYADPTPTGIPWRMRTAITDFGSRQKKVVRETFIHGRLGSTVSAKVSVGEKADVTYAAVIQRGTKAHRIKYGKGLQAQYWSFELADSAGSEFDMDAQTHDAQPTSRKL